MKHELKTWPSFYRAVESGEKTFEVRFHDRDYAVGDLLELREYNPSSTDTSYRGYTGNKITKRVSYVMLGGQFGIDRNWCVLGLAAPKGEER